MGLTLPDLDENPNTWAKATAALRVTLYWFVIAGGLLAAALFGTALVARPTLSWEDDRGRLLIAWSLATVGIGAAVGMLAIVVSLYRPRTVRLNALPATLLAEVEASPREYLPPDVADVTELRRLIPAQYALARVRESELGAALDAEAAASAADRPQRKLEADRSRALYRAASARHAELVAASTALLDRAGYEALVASKKTSWLVALAILTGSLGVGFQLLLTTPEEAGPTGGSNAAGDSVRPGTAAVLVRDTTSEANNALWRTLRLAACVSAGSGANIPILVDSGRGTADAPYVVRTLPEAAAGSGCPRITFNAVDAVSRVILPTDEISVKVEYSPAPEPRASATR